MLQLLEPLVVSWSRRWFGFTVGGGQPLNHSSWSDDIFVLASDTDQFRVMLGEPTEVIHRHKLRWKESSLEYLQVVRSPPEHTMLVTSLGLGDAQVKCVQEWYVLGVVLDSQGVKPV